MTDVTTRRRRSPAVAVLAVLVVVALVGGAWWAVRTLTGGRGDYPGPGSGEVEVRIDPGASLSAMGRVLVDARVVKSVNAFTSAAAANPQSSRIGPGRYRMLEKMSGAGAVQRLLDPAAKITNQVTLAEGLKQTETLAKLAAATGLPLKDFEAAAVNPRLGLPAYANGRAEGYLFPATYTWERDQSALDILSATVTRFGQAERTVGLPAAAADVGLTPAQVVTVASLLEAEARPEDFAKVSRVIQNRLAAGMPLQLDSTVNYALNRDTVKVTNQDLTVDSPYNTYRIRGLPPGPINSPGEAALRAALAPADGDWLYFVTVNPATGETKFTADYNEFLKFKDELKANS